MTLGIAPSEYDRLTIAERDAIVAEMNKKRPGRASRRRRR